MLIEHDLHRCTTVFPWIPIRRQVVIQTTQRRCRIGVNGYRQRARLARLLHGGLKISLHVQAHGKYG